MSGEIFQVGWGRLEAEVARWRGGDLRRDRGRLGREGRVVGRVLGEWGVGFGGREGKGKGEGRKGRGDVGEGRGGGKRAETRGFWRGMSWL